MQSLRTAAILKALKDQGLDGKEIISLFKDGGLEGLAVLAGEDK